MSQEPWDQPCTPEGREALSRLAQEYETEGKLREYGHTLIRLAHTVKEVGSGEGHDAFALAAQLGQKAVAALRQTDDKQGLATALRAAAQPVIANMLASAHGHEEPVQVNTSRDALLQEALQISSEIGDFSGQGWANYSLSKFNRKAKEYLFEARRCFEIAKDKNGLALTSQSQAIESRDLSLFLQAADLFTELGQTTNAYRALVMASTFCSDTISDEELEPLLKRALDIAITQKENHYQQMILNKLTSLMARLENHDEASKYQTMLDKLPPTEEFD